MILADDERNTGSFGLRHLIGAIGGNWASSAIWWLQPLLMRELAIDRGYGESKAGLLIFIELALMSLSSAVLTKYVPTARLGRAALAGIVLAIIASVISLEVSTFSQLAMSRVLAGIGEGAALMMSNSVAAGFRDPDSAFGKITVVNILFGVVLIPAVGLLHGAFPSAPSYAAIGATLIVAVLLIVAMPRTASLTATSWDAAVGAISARQMRNIWLVAFATFLIGMASGTMWAFYAVIGDKAGLTPDEVNTAVSISVFAGLVGAGLAAAIGSRFGRLAPLSGGILVMAGAIMLLSFGPTAMNFRVATCINVGCLYFLVPFFLGAGSAQHESGRGASYVGASFYFTGALGPVTGGVLTETLGLQVMGVAVLVIAAVTIGIFVWVFAISKSESGSAAVNAAIAPSPGVAG